MAHYSPAAIELLRNGVTSTAVADELGIPKQSVSLQLKGKRTPHPRLLLAVAEVGGVDLASTVGKLIPDNRAAQ